METHLIKRYANRKLYDTHSRRYVTLDVVADLLQRGHEVRVTDRQTGEDITSQTLSQILLDGSRNGVTLPESVLVDLVKERGEQLLGVVRAGLSLPRGIRTRAAAGVGRSAQTLERSVDDVFTTGLRNLNIATSEELAALRRDLDDLAQRVAQLSEQAAAPPRRRRHRP